MPDVGRVVPMANYLSLIWPKLLVPCRLLPYLCVLRLSCYCAFISECELAHMTQSTLTYLHLETFKSEKSEKIYLSIYNKIRTKKVAPTPFFFCFVFIYFFCLHFCSCFIFFEPLLAIIVLFNKIIKLYISICWSGVLYIFFLVFLYALSLLLFLIFDFWFLFVCLFFFFSLDSITM